MSTQSLSPGFADGIAVGSHHASEVSRAPSSYNGRKRARLSTTSPSASPSHSRPASVTRHPTDSWPSRTGTFSPLHRAASKTASMRSGARPESMIAAVHRNTERRRSMSEISIPISALVAPHAPSMSVRSSMYHMRDPRKPPRVHPTPWYLERRTAEQEGSPTHAWFFFLGFILFPLWYLASFWRIPKTRQVGGTDTEKAVTLDDPQVEHGECCLDVAPACLKAIVCRCEVMAFSVSHHVRGVPLYLHSLHRSRRDLRASQLVALLAHHTVIYLRLPWLCHPPF